MEVDIAEDTGHHVSVAIDPVFGGVYVSYYDATAQHLRMAHYVQAGGNCGAFGSAQCEEIGLMPADYRPLGISIALDVEVN
jgi:hypothetical protein